MSERIVEPRCSLKPMCTAMNPIAGIFMALLFGCANAENAATYFDPVWADQWSPAVTDAYGTEKIESRR
jgi:hypothetical protein